VRHQSKHGDERDRVAESDHGARPDRQGQGRRQRERELAGRHERGTRDDQDPRTVAVEQYSGGHLGAGVHDDLQHHERRQHGRGGVKSFGRIQP
jgi:hypothetical protein